MDSAKNQNHRWKSTLAAARMAYESGQFRQSAGLLGRLREMVKDGPDRNFVVSVSDLGLGIVFLAEGRLDEAQKQLELVMRSLSTSVQPELCELYGLSLRYHAQLLIERADLATAEQELKECVATFAKLGPTFAAQMSYAISDLSGLYVLQGDFAIAHEYMVESITILGSILGPEHPEYERADTLYKISQAADVQERFDLAECGLVRMQYQLGAHHPDIVFGLRRYVYALRKNGQHERLNEIREKFLAIDKEVKL